MEDKKKTWFAEIVSGIIGIVGIVTTIISTFIADTNRWFFVYFVFLAAETLLVIIIMWNIKIRYDYEKSVDSLKEQKEKICNILSAKEEAAKELEHKYKKTVSVIATNIKSISKLHNELCNRIPKISEKSYHILMAMEQSGVENVEVAKKEINNSCTEFSIGLFDLYKRYSTNLLTSAVTIIESYLKLNDYSHKVSMTIKLFNKPLYDKDSRGDITVYTAFRDKRTYEENEREIGIAPYTIDGNADFTICLQKEQFVINNAKKDSENYLNEHKDFDAYYNCAAVVPIRLKQVDSSFKFFGYLCCDCLNTDENVEVLDKEVAQLLFSMAQSYATFLETLNANWIDRVKNIEGQAETFLEKIFDKTFRNKKR